MLKKNDGPSRELWLTAGLRALAEGGIETVKVERLADEIGVSKAPFYWRFKDRAALLNAMLEYWKSDLTEDLIEKVAHHKTPRARLEALMALALEEKTDGLDVSGIEGAIRAWAAQDASIRPFVQAVDDMRIRHVANELMRLGADRRAALTLSRGIYLALIGIYTARRYTPRIASDDAYVAIFLAALDAAQSSRSKGARSK